MITLLRLLLPLVFLAVGFIASILRDVHAQPLDMRMPSAANLSEAASAVPSRKEIDEAVTNKTGTVVPKVPAGPATGKPIDDLASLAKKYEAAKGAATQDPSVASSEQPISGLMMFVSLSMPPATLERIFADAERYRFPLILRGVQERSVKKTAARISQLIGKRRVAWSIDPRLFRRFEVDTVPALVLVDPSRPVNPSCAAPNAAQQCEEISFAKVSGDVSAAYALAAVQREDAEFSDLASRLLTTFGQR